VAQGEEKEEEKKEEEKAEDGRMGDSAFNWTCAFLSDLHSDRSDHSVDASDLDTGAERQENEAEKEKERKMLGPSSKEELRKAHHVRHLPYRTSCFVPFLRS